MSYIFVFRLDFISSFFIFNSSIFFSYDSIFYSRISSFSLIFCESNVIYVNDFDWSFDGGDFIWDNEVFTYVFGIILMEVGGWENYTSFWIDGVKELLLTWTDLSFNAIVNALLKSFWTLIYFFFSSPFIFSIILL